MPLKHTHKHKHRPLFILSIFVPQVALLHPSHLLLLFIACFQTNHLHTHCAQRVPPSSQIGTLVSAAAARHNAFPQCGHICRGLLGARTTGSSSAPSASPCQTLRLSNGPPQLPGCSQRPPMQARPRGAWSLDLYVAPSVILHCCWPCHSLNPAPSLARFTLGLLLLINNHGVARWVASPSPECNGPRGGNALYPISCESRHFACLSSGGPKAEAEGTRHGFTLPVPPVQPYGVRGPLSRWDSLICVNPPLPACLSCCEAGHLGESHQCWSEQRIFGGRKGVREGGRRALSQITGTCVWASTVPEPVPLGWAGLVLEYSSFQGEVEES